MKHDNTDNFQLSELQTNQECLLECVNMYVCKGFDFDELFPCDLNADTIISLASRVYLVQSPSVILRDLVSPPCQNLWHV